VVGAHVRARRGGGRLYDLTASNPTTAGLHYENERILRALQHPRALEYEPASKGILAAREAVSTPLDFIVPQVMDGSRLCPA